MKEESKRAFNDGNSNTFIGRDESSDAAMGQQKPHRPLADMMSLSDMSHLNK